MQSVMRSDGGLQRSFTRVVTHTLTSVLACGVTLAIDSGNALAATAEAGYPQRPVRLLMGFPRGVPPAIARRVHGIVQQGVAGADMKAKLTEQGLDVVEGMTPEDTARFVRQDVARWAEVIRRGGLAPGG